MRPNKSPNKVLIEALIEALGTNSLVARAYEEVEQVSERWWVCRRAGLGFKEPQATESGKSCTVGGNHSIAKHECGLRLLF